MTGKVFRETTNIYQDQAKVLFDYYKTAAEKIVGEEMSIEQMKADLDTQMAQQNDIYTKSKKLMPVFLIAGGVLTVIGAILTLFFMPAVLLAVAGIVCLIMGFVNLKKSSDAQKRINDLIAELNKLRERYMSIRRNYTVDKIGVAYVPVATRVPFEGKSFLIDHTHTVDNKDFHLTLLNQPEEFQKSISSLQKSMEKLPVIEGNESCEQVDTSEYSLSVQNVTLHDYVGNIDRQVRNISYLLNDSDQVSVEIPVIEPKSAEADFIRDHGTTENNGKPVIQVFDTNFEDKVEKLAMLNSSKNQFDTGDSDDSTDYLKSLLGQMAEAVTILSKSKNAGASSLMMYTTSILGNVLKSGYNQYSPLLEAEEIERIRNTSFDYKTEVNNYTPFNLKKSSEVKYDIFSNNWVAGDGSRTIRPFGMHQVDEEVLQPVISMLMEENRTECLRIYSSIEDQKRVYLDRWSSEIGNYFRDNRAACDELINRMRETYADYVSACTMYKALSDTTNLMKQSGRLEDAEVNEINAEAEMIAGFEEQARICNEKQQQFSEYMDRIQDSINEMTDDFSHIEYYEAALRDTVSHDTAVAMANILNLDDRRRQLLGISPYIANYAELPPEPSVTEALEEHLNIDLEGIAREQLASFQANDQMTTASTDTEGV